MRNRHSETRNGFMFGKISRMRFVDRGIYLFLFALAFLVYFLGLFIPLIDPDANEYASIALRMVQRNDYVNIISRNINTLQEFDYLDKPHLLFWLVAFSFKIFGVHDWSYRLPSVLFTVLGTYSTYRLGTLLYAKEAGRMAALIFLSSLAIILFNHDVRTDTILTSAVIFGIWQLAEFVQKEKLLNMVLGAAGIALGVATKGMIAVLVAGTAIFFHIVYRRQWKLFLNWKWLAGLAAFLVTLAPVLYCYYLQFDLHPEKFVNGGYGRSGIKFIFWTQSFERLSGDRNMQSSPEFSFFYHTLLWAILPWSILVYASVFGRIKRFWQLRFRATKELEALTLATILIIFHLMSASRFKLPHYLNILFPLFAVLLASYLYNAEERRKEKLLNVFVQVQYVVVGILVLLTIALNVWAFPVKNIFIIAGGLILLALLMYAYRVYKAPLPRILVPSAIAILLLAFCLNANFYPRLLQYQSGEALVALMKKEGIQPKQVFLYKKLSYSIDFRLRQTTPNLSDSAIQQKESTGQPFYLVVFAEDWPAIEAMQLNVTKKNTLKHFHVSRLDGKFLNPSSREKSLGELYVVKVN